MPRAATAIVVVSPVATRTASDFLAGVVFSTVLVTVVLDVAAGLVSGFVSGFTSGCGVGLESGVGCGSGAGVASGVNARLVLSHSVRIQPLSGSTSLHLTHLIAALHAVNHQGACPLCGGFGV